MVDLNTIIELTNNFESDINYLVNVAGELKKQGITDCVLTPKTKNILLYDDLDLTYERLVDSISSKVKGINFRKGINFKLSLANDYKGNYDKFIIENTNYVNLELSFRQVWGHKYISRVEEFIALTGLIPIINTIEYYPSIHKNPNLVQTLIENDCIISASIESIFNKKNRKLIFLLISKGMLDVFVTSTKYENTSEIRINKAIKILESKFGKKAIDKILQNSIRILNNKEIPRYYHKPIKKIFGIYF